MKMPTDPEELKKEMEYAISKTREFFEQLVWDDLRDRDLDAETELRAAVILSKVGDELEEKLKISPRNYGKMLIMAGATILAALKDNQDDRSKQARWN